MKKILQVVDIFGWAIDELAGSLVQNTPQYEWQRIAVHPKAIERGEVDLDPIRLAVEKADIIDFQYWRTCSQLAEKIPEIKNKKVILTHHNEKSILSEPWDFVDQHIVCTQKSFDILSEKYNSTKINLIHNSFDPDRFHFNTEYPPKNEKITVGYVGRIVPWKGLKEVLQACYELGYAVMIMGKEDSREYWNTIPEKHRQIIDWSYFNCEDSDVPEFYKEIDLYVGNSGSGRETGPLGLIEAMASGVPCVTTPSGIANDICEDQENSLVIDFGDYDGLKSQLQNLVESAGLRNSIRNCGWNSIRNYNHENRAYKISKVIDKLMYEDDIVSIILPSTHGRFAEVQVILDSLIDQLYKTFEVIVIFDEVSPAIDKMLDPTLYPFAVRVLYTGSEGYNLGMARNMGTIEASGKYLMFCDSRLKPEKDAITQFITRINKKDKLWLFGEKGGKKVNFVENFSFIKRSNFIKAGMMNERINGYGGLSQELRDRFTGQGFKLIYTPEAVAEQLMSGRKSTERRDSIIKMKNLLARMYE